MLQQVREELILEGMADLCVSRVAPYSSMSPIKTHLQLVAGLLEVDKERADVALEIVLVLCALRDVAWVLLRQVLVIRLPLRLGRLQISDGPAHKVTRTGRTVITRSSWSYSNVSGVTLPSLMGGIVFDRVVFEKKGFSLKCCGSAHLRPGSEARRARTKTSSYGRGSAGSCLSSTSVRYDRASRSDADEMPNSGTEALHQSPPANRRTRLTKAWSQNLSTPLTFSPIAFRVDSVSSTWNLSHRYFFSALTGRQLCAQRGTEILTLLQVSNELVGEVCASAAAPKRATSTRREQRMTHRLVRFHRPFCSSCEGVSITAVGLRSKCCRILLQTVTANEQSKWSPQTFCFRHHVQ